MTGIFGFFQRNHTLKRLVQGSGSGRFKCGDQRISLLGKHGDSSGRFELSL